MKVVVLASSDDYSGGAKQLYRQVDILNENGIEAVAAHETKNFRLAWFKNNTRTCCLADVELSAEDFLVVGEQVDEFPKVRGLERCGEEVLVQNPYGMLMGFRKNLGGQKEGYGAAAGVFCQSKYTEDNVRHFFPAARIFSFRYSFDRPPFAYSGNKQKIVTY